MAQASGWDYFHYVPSEPAAGIFIGAFALTTGLHLYQMVKHKTWIFVPMVIGGIFEFVGYVGRVICTKQAPQYTLGPYITQALLILVAPALFAASIYMLVGRIILVTNGEGLALVGKRWLTKGFVLCDIVSFTVQGAGAGLLAGQTQSLFNTGSNVIIAALLLQVITFGVFMIVGVNYHSRLSRNPTPKAKDPRVPWRKHLHVLYIASLFIMIRCVFRVVEYAQGQDGVLLHHETFAYVFDALLMFAVMVTFNIFHPNEIVRLLRYPTSFPSPEPVEEEAFKLAIQPNKLTK